MPAPLTLSNTILTLDAALAGCGAGVVASGRTAADCRHPGGRGSDATLPAMALGALQSCGLAAAQLTAIAVTVGPGSFTGVRAALSLAHGIGLAAHIPVIGVSVGDAIRAGLASARPVWIAIDSKRERMFLDDGASIRTVSLGALPEPPGPITVAGDAAEAAARRWVAQGVQAIAAPFQGLSPQAIAAASRTSPRPALPLYVDPPDARPGAAVRPAPAG